MTLSIFSVILKSLRFSFNSSTDMIYDGTQMQTDGIISTIKNIVCDYVVQAFSRCMSN